VVGEWGSADRSRSDELQFAAPVVRLGPARRTPRRGVQGGVARETSLWVRLIKAGLMHLRWQTITQGAVWPKRVIKVNALADRLVRGSFGPKLGT